MFEPEARRHGRFCRPLIDNVHEPRSEDVILMMAEGYLVETSLDGKGEKSLAAMPRTQETTSLARISTLVKTGMENVKRQSSIATKPLKILCVCLIRNIVHDNMRSLNTYRRTEDA